MKLNETGIPGPTGNKHCCVMGF